MLNAQHSTFNVQRSAFNIRRSTFNVPWQASALTIILIVLAACGATPTIVEQRVVDGLTITLERPAQPVALRDYEFVAKITDTGKQPVEATLVYFDFTMPQMEMGVHQPIADRLGPGTYGVRTLYSMEGDWRITVVATIDGRDIRAWFDHPVLPP